MNRSGLMFSAPTHDRSSMVKFNENGKDLVRTLRTVHFVNAILLGQR